MPFAGGRTSVPSLKLHVVSFKVTVLLESPEHRIKRAFRNIHNFTDILRYPVAVSSFKADNRKNHSIKQGGARCKHHRNLLCFV